MQAISIIDRGRGPELAGTRITIFDVLPYFEEGWHHSSIAAWFDLSSAQVLALQEYFQAHRDEVLALNQKILARSAQGNAAAVEARRAISHAQLVALKDKLRRQREQENNGASNSG